MTQVRSGISTKPKHRGTLRALGLRGVGRSRVLPDRPDVRGMLARVPHLVTVELAGDDEAAHQRERNAPARRARRVSGRRMAEDGGTDTGQEGAPCPQGARMKLHDLRPPAGANRPKRRVGRGIAGKGGKTAGRGTKGTGARGSVPPGFEGGQLQLAQRIPKLKGFHNPFRVEYAVVNLDTLEAFAGEEATPTTLSAVGRVRKGALVKVLGRGELHRAMHGPGPRRVGVGPRCDRGRRRERRDPAHALRQRASAGAGQRAHQPVASYSRVPVRSEEEGRCSRA